MNKQQTKIIVTLERNKRKEFIDVIKEFSSDEYEMPDDYYKLAKANKQELRILLLDLLIYYENES
jgi:hypothetical protein